MHEEEKKKNNNPEKQTEAARLDARHAEERTGIPRGSCRRLFYRLKESTTAEPRVASKPLQSPCLRLVAVD